VDHRYEFNCELIKAMTFAETVPVPIAQQWATQPGLELAANLPANWPILADFLRFSLWGHRTPIFFDYPQKFPQFPVAGAVRRRTSLHEKIARFSGFPQDFWGFLYVYGRGRTSMELGRVGLEPTTKALKGPCSTN
jgi:hypothetical protein